MKWLFLVLALSLMVSQIAFASAGAKQNLVPLDTFFLDGKTGWSALKNGANLSVIRTSDGGAQWAKAVELGQVFDLNEAHLNFIDTQHGWLLALSSPATGKMGEMLFRTENGGQNWQKIADSEGNGLRTLPFGGFYPNGLTFRNARDGWIAGEYRGFPDFPVLATHDGGVTWHFQPFPVPAEFRDGGYGNTCPPVFFADSKVGVLPVELHNYSKHKNLEKLAVYLTRDGGATWTLAPQ